MATTPFLGLYTAVYAAPDLDKARAWYADVLGIPPYFSEPFYVGFNVGGFELGLDPDAEPFAGANAYWGVADARAAYARLIALGAQPAREPQDVGGGVVVASVIDPFGNKLGIVENPHFPNQA
jgi:catechol 2,3-dioxygenase-like lactoylglutathione lyase family enzyme